MSRKGHAERRRRSQARLTLGISARRAASPLAAARISAQARAEDYARAIVDAPLDDNEIGSLSRQKAAIAALELLYPQTTATVDVALPDNVEDVRKLGWNDLQTLAQRILSEHGDDVEGEYVELD